MADQKLATEINSIRTEYESLLKKVIDLGSRLPGGIDLVAETCHGGDFCHGGTTRTSKLDQVVNPQLRTK